MAIFSISHSETGKKLLNLKSPVDLLPLILMSVHLLKKYQP